MAIPIIGTRIIHVKRAAANLLRTPSTGAFRPSSAGGSNSYCASASHAVGVSLTWLLHFLVECFTACPDHWHAQFPAQPTEVLRSRLEAEADDMWSLVQKKA